MNIFTIGFTQKTAEQFFESLISAGVQRLIDVRLNNSSQLSAFAKKADLEYFLRRICNIEYLHMPILAPTQQLLDGYKKQHRNWSTYEQDFLALLTEREIENVLEQDLFAKPCALLCSELSAKQCHRSTVVKYLQAAGWELTEIDL